MTSCKLVTSKESLKTKLIVEFDFETASKAEETVRELRDRNQWTWERELADLIEGK